MLSSNFFFLQIERRCLNEIKVQIYRSFSVLKKSPFDIIEKSLIKFESNFRKNLPRDYSPLTEMVIYATQNSGKMFRPCLNLLFAHAIGTNKISNEQIMLAEVTELIHTCSIIHDDIIDKSDKRRNVESVSKKYGEKAAVMCGNFFLARASYKTALIGNPSVTKLVSNTIEDLVNGELLQIKIEKDFRFDKLMNMYINKNYLKTASLFEKSCKEIAILSGCNNELINNVGEYGKNLGIAFQIKDDLLDFESSLSNETGKTTNLDIENRILTAPILFAAKDDKAIRTLVTKQKLTDKDKKAIREISMNPKYLAKTNKLIQNFSKKAEKNITSFKSKYKNALISILEHNFN